MEYRPLDLTVLSAKDLKNVNYFTKMDVYADVYLAGAKQRTPVDKVGGNNPNWNFLMKFSVVEEAAQWHRVVLTIKIRSQRFFRDRNLGEIHVPIKDLLDAENGDRKNPQFVSYQVRRPSGRAKGVLNFSYKFGEMITAPAIFGASTNPNPNPNPISDPNAASSKGHEPMNAGAYGAPGPAVPYPPQPNNYMYPQPQGLGYGYGAPPPPGYGYGYPSQGGYGYTGQAQARRSNNSGMGMGMGAGLLGGALGGILIGDMISDSAGYDASYDAGFADGGFDGGFDF